MYLLRKSKTKNNYIFFILTALVFSGVFFFSTNIQVAHADIAGHNLWTDLGMEVPEFFKNPWAVVGDTISVPFKWIIYGFIKVFILLSSAALVLFEYIIRPENISGDTGILNLPVVYNLWKFVRDFLNLFFILVLLFSAFATIFQIQQYSIRKIFLNILLAALLVNFSYPITRFLIDTTNVPMYYFASNINGGQVAGAGKDAAYSKVLSASEFSELILAKDKDGNTSVSDTDWSNLFMGAIFMFIFAISVTVLSLMMFVRLIGLTVLLIFSSIGFVASAIPGLQRFSNQWWDKFWNYALFGPAALLMLLVSVRFMSETAAFRNSFKTIGTGISGSPADLSMIVSMVLFSIPIILIFMTISVANSFSIAGAGAVTGWGKKMAVGGIRKMTGASWAQRNWASYTAQRKKRQDEKNRNNLGTRLGKGFNTAQDTVVAGLGSKAAQERLSKLAAERVEEAAKDHGTEYMNPSDLRRLASSGDKFERAAALRELANKQALDLSDASQKKAYDDMVKEMGTTSEVFRKINTKLRAYDPVGAFSHITDTAQRQEAITTHLNSNQFDHKKLSLNSLNNDEFMTLAMQNQAMKPKDLEELRNYSNYHEDAIKNVLGRIQGSFTNHTQRADQNVQMAYMAQTGELSSTAAADANWQRQIFRTMDKDTAKRMSQATINTYETEIINNVNPKNYKEIIKNMNQGAHLNGKVKGAAGRGTTVGRMATSDPELQAIG